MPSYEKAQRANSLTERDEELIELARAPPRKRIEALFRLATSGKVEKTEFWRRERAVHVREEEAKRSLWGLEEEADKDSVLAVEDA